MTPARQILAATYRAGDPAREAILNDPADEFGPWFAHTLEAIESVLTPKLASRADTVDRIVAMGLGRNLAHMIVALFLPVPAELDPEDGA